MEAVKLWQKSGWWQREPMGSIESNEAHPLDSAGLLASGVTASVASWLLAGLAGTAGFVTCSRR